MEHELCMEAGDKKFQYRIRSKTPKMNLHKIFRFVIHFFFTLGYKEYKSALNFSTDI